MRDLSQNLMILPFLAPSTVTASVGNLSSAFDSWYDRSGPSKMIVFVTIASTWAAGGSVIIQVLSSDTSTASAYTTHTDYTMTCLRSTGIFHFFLEIKNFKRYVKVRYDVVTQTAIMAIVGILDYSRRVPVGIQTTVSEPTLTTSSCSCSCSSCSSSSSSSST